VNKRIFSIKSNRNKRAREFKFSYACKELIIGMNLKDNGSDEEKYSYASVIFNTAVK